MFKGTIICVGKFKEKAYQDLEDEFLKRIKPFASLKLVQLPDSPYKSEDSMEKAKLEEAELIKKHIPKGSMVLLLQENGQTRDSKEFAVFLERIGSIGQEICFVIGGGAGLHSSLQEIANYYISLSPLTFPHNLARIILEEQIYRAITIMIGKSYHK